ncbi:hypothetical protein ACF3NA_01265 [Alkanindiges sp. WGS2144]|uniref:hypothetical protein n=1 Tax=Alkanindiges sp. WGS2144 TaxID=3366808 RepID=UPI003750AC15
MIKVARTTGLISGLAAALMLAGCGGSSSDDYGPAVDNQPGGHLFGFYAESMDVDDPDPTVGGIYVDAPNGTGKIKGRMSFRYFACQSGGMNSLEIKGTKATNHITGNAEGDLDSESSINDKRKISVSFDTSYSRAQDRYTGKYTIGGNDKNDERTIKDCDGTSDQTFTLARKGSLTLYPANTVFPDKFDIGNAGLIISWKDAPSDARTLLVNIINEDAMGNSNANGIIYQQVADDLRLLTTAIPASAVESGKEYIVVVQMFDKNNQPVAFKQEKMTF